MDSRLFPTTCRPPIQNLIGGCSRPDFQQQVFAGETARICAVSAQNCAVKLWTLGADLCGSIYCLSRVEMPVDMKCAFLIEAFIGVGEIIQSKKSEFVLPKRKSREESQLGLDLKYIISHYGQEIFRGEYQKDLEGFVQILVNSRNRIAHIKSKQNRKFLNGDESVLYLHKLSLMYRIILLDLLDIPLNRYKERLSNRIETINCWWADRCDQ